MLQTILVLTISLSAALAHASVKTKVIEVVTKKESPSAWKSPNIAEEASLGTKKEFRYIFAKVHLDPSLHDSGTASRVVRDSFDNGSMIDANLRVDYFRKKKVTLFEIDLKNVDLNSAALKSLAKDAVKIQRSRSGGIFIQHVVPDRGVTDDLATRFSKYYETLIRQDYYD